MTLSGKTALITGSTSGIGLGIATVLASKGCNIVLNGFGDKAEIERIRKELAKNVHVTYDPADMRDPEAIRAMVVRAAKDHGTLDILVNNAGIQHVDSVEDFPIEKWDAVIAINLSSAFHGIAAAVPIMKQQNFGRIMNIASAHGLVASAKKAAYVAAKHGIVGLSKVIALETATLPITCNAICPGWVLTPLVQKQIDAIAEREKLSPEQAKLKLLSEKQPAQEFVTPEQIGEYVAFLSSDAAAMITGAALSIDGGWVAQ
jgi:3-hydroxybutyrate dehydrogenase